MNRWTYLSLMGPLLALACFASCSNARSGFETPPPEATFDTTADAAVDDVRAARVHRTQDVLRDLRAIVDACDESKVLATCAAEEGCAESACVPACSAAVSTGSSVGCEFVATAPARNTEGSGSCFAAFFANTWATPTQLEAEFDGQSLDVTTAGRIRRTTGDEVSYDPFSGDLQPGEVAVLFLSQAPSSSGLELDSLPEGDHAGRARRHVRPRDATRKVVPVPDVQAGQRLQH